VTPGKALLETQSTGVRTSGRSTVRCRKAMRLRSTQPRNFPTVTPRRRRPRLNGSQQTSAIGTTTHSSTPRSTRSPRAAGSERRRRCSRALTGARRGGWSGHRQTGQRSMQCPPRSERASCTRLADSERRQLVERRDRYGTHLL